MLGRKVEGSEYLITPLGLAREGAPGLPLLEISCVIAGHYDCKEASKDCCTELRIAVQSYGYTSQHFTYCFALVTTYLWWINFYEKRLE